MVLANRADDAAASGFARVRAGYLAMEVEDDGSFTPMFMQWDTTPQGNRGPRIPEMPVQQRTWEAKQAAEKYVAALQALAAARVAGCGY